MTVSARTALIIRAPIFGSLAQKGISPHFMNAASRPSTFLTVSTLSVGAML